MTRIFEALKKARVKHASGPPPGPPPIHPLRAHMAGGTAGAASPAVTPERLGLVVHSCKTVPELPDDVLREMMALRMTLETALGSRAPRVVLFTSAMRGEGTSTVATQFAAALAGDVQHRVLLLDLNARRPSAFIEEAGRPGGAETPAVQPIRGAEPGPRRLDALPVPESARRAGVVSAPAVREWIDALADRYDWIVLDGPPVLDAPDAPPLGAVADGVVIVVEAGRTKRPVLHRATDLLRKARANLIGTVLNRRRLEIPEFLYRRI